MSTKRRAYVRIVACLFLIALSPARAPKAVAGLPASLTGSAVLDDWGNRFTSLGASIPENALRTQIRTTIAQLAMFDAVNAVLHGPYHAFASRPPSPYGASAEAAAIRAAYIVARNEFPMKTATIDSAYDASIAVLGASPGAIADGILVGEAAANVVLAARVGDHRNDPDLAGYTLFEVPFDVNRLEVTGQPIAVVQGVKAFKVSGASLFDISDTGTLAYVAGDLIGTDAPMMWMRRDGTMTLMRAVPRDWRAPQFSPDGKRIAFHLDDGRQLDVYTYEWARDFTTRLTSDPAVDSYPVWSQDGRTIVFSSSRGVKQLANLYWVPADGSGEAHRLTEGDERKIASSWHPSGKYLAFDQQISPHQWDLMVLPMDVSGSGWKAGTPTRVMSKIAQPPTAVFSPDGRWLAYTSNESGRSEVSVRSFPGAGAQWQVSTSGGWLPTWSRRRNELFYLSPDSHLMAVSYTIEGDTFRANPPQKWSEQPITGRPTSRWFDLHPDGDRFLVSGDLGTRTNVDKVVLVTNFFDETRRRLSDARR